MNIMNPMQNTTNLSIICVSLQDCVLVNILSNDMYNGLNERMKTSVENIF